MGKRIRPADLSNGSHLPEWQLITCVLFFFVVSMITPASATDPLGTVSASTISCSSVGANGGVQGATCYLAQVSCPGITEIPVALKVNTPKGKSAGTVLYTTEGGGSTWYDVGYTFGKTAVQNVLDAGFTTVQFDFSYPPLGKHSPTFAGWLTGPGGPLALSCRWASLAQWVHDNISSSHAPFCATGNSAGAGAASYAIAYYGMDTEFKMLEQTSGPPFARIDNGCLCNTPPVQTPCGQGAVSECYGTDANLFLNPAYNNTACSTAERTHQSSYRQIFFQDSLDWLLANFNYPNTDIHIVFGGLDDSSAVSQAMDWKGLITSKGLPTVSCVANAPHSLADVREGAEKIANDIIAYCK